MQAMLGNVAVLMLSWLEVAAQRFEPAGSIASSRFMDVDSMPPAATRDRSMSIRTPPFVCVKVAWPISLPRGLTNVADVC
jgi:hypothetical protein